MDLQRVEDLIAEVQSQIRSLARQRGKAERHARLMEEKFAVQLTLVGPLLPVASMLILWNLKLIWSAGTAPAAPLPPV